MHYMNGRLVQVGDWVVGRTHGGERGLAIGVVVAEMPVGHGNCNVKLFCWKGTRRGLADEACEEISFLTLLGPDDGKQTVGRLRNWYPDYADAADLVPVDDAFRMVQAVVDHGLWDSKYT